MLIFTSPLNSLLYQLAELSSSATTQRAVLGRVGQRGEPLPKRRTMEVDRRDVQRTSSSSDIIPTVVHTATPNSEHVTKWNKDHPLVENRLGIRSFTLETLKQLADEAEE
ncbi:hypothetical protein Tco_1467252 [Tanacetum coccineum]